MTRIETPHTPEELLQLVKSGHLKAARFENVAGELVATIEFQPALEFVNLRSAVVQMTDPHATQVLNAAAFAMGQDAKQT